MRVAAGLLAATLLAGCFGGGCEPDGTYAHWREPGIYDAVGGLQGATIGSQEPPGSSRFLHDDLNRSWGDAYVLQGLMVESGDQRVSLDLAGGEVRLIAVGEEGPLRPLAHGLLADATRLSEEERVGVVESLFHDTVARQGAMRHTASGDWPLRLGPLWDEGSGLRDNATEGRAHHVFRSNATWIFDLSWQHVTASGDPAYRLHVSGAHWVFVEDFLSQEPGSETDARAYGEAAFDRVGLPPPSFDGLWVGHGLVCT